jgi:hypothetical protein
MGCKHDVTQSKRRPDMTWDVIIRAALAPLGPRPYREEQAG